MIDIIIPTYNRGDCISRALESCEGRPVIVIDDGSTDNTKEVVSKYPNTSYYYIPHTGLPGKVKDIGVRKGTSEYFCILDSDDYLLPRAIEVMERSLKGHPVLAYSYHYHDGVPGKNTGIKLSNITMIESCPIRSLCVIRRKEYNLVGGFNLNMPAAVDTDLYFRIYQDFWRECVTVKKFLYYRDTTRNDRISLQRKEVQDQLHRKSRQSFAKRCETKIHLHRKSKKQ
jgi:glycosyltransferase involved in cell wall biosynthesis